jgi:two-component system chemotaxis response regulator CheY
MTRQILVVDDAVTVRLYHRRTLSAAGWQVEEASNGMEALERVMSQPPERPFDLYVVDVNMPKMDGYRFVRELRQLDGVAQAPVLMVSTEAQAQDSGAARDAGANGYVIKPARPADLVLTAALMMGDAQAAQRAAEAHLSAGGRA